MGLVGRCLPRVACSPTRRTPEDIIQTYIDQDEGEASWGNYSLEWEIADEGDAEGHFFVTFDAVGVAVASASAGDDRCTGSRRANDQRLTR